MKNLKKSLLEMKKSKKMTNEEVLYDVGKIKIVYQLERDGHGVFIDGQFIFLARGVLEELARTPGRDLIYRLNLVDDGFGYILEREGITPIALGFAIAQARISELEKENHSYRRLPHYLPKVIPVPK